MPDASPPPLILNRTTPRRVPLGWIITLCALWGLWSAQRDVLVAMVSGGRVEWLRPLGLAMSTAAFWALLTPVIMTTTRFIRDRTTSRVQWLAAHVLTFLVLHVIDVAVYSRLTAWFAPNPRPFAQLVFSLTTFNMITYGMIAVVTAALDYQDDLRERGLRAAQLETQLAMAQFQALRAQLHPHFLFNALNAISALIRKDADRAERMLARLSELLRMAIETAATPEVRLIDEIEFVKRYLDIERMRFGERLDVHVAVDGEAYDALVPSMLLQPLVENAVRHGVAPYAGPGRVEIRATRDDSRLAIVVRDSGPGIQQAPNDSNGEGVGLRTTRQRLQKLYGEAQDLTLINVPGGFETRIAIPFRKHEAAQ